jgi:hypothetical protein
MILSKKFRTYSIFVTLTSLVFSQSVFSVTHSGKQAVEDRNEGQAEIKETIDDSHKTVTRILQIAVQTEEIGGETLERIGDQNEQLDRVQSSIDQISAHTNVAKKHLDEIKHLVPWRRVFMTNSTPSHHVKKVCHSSKKSRKKKGKDLQAEVSSEEFSKFIDDSLLDTEDKEKLVETDQMLDQVSASLDRLKQTAVAIGDELDESNQRLDTMIKTTKQAEVKVRNLAHETRQSIVDADSCVSLCTLY